MLIPILIGVGVFAVFLMAITVFVITLRRVVPTNMVHIVQSRKTTTSYGKDKTDGNVYYQWPAWIPGIGVVVSEFPESVFDISLENYEAYDTGRLPFMVDVKAFFRVEESATAAQRVASFGELKQQLQAVLQGAVRRILGTNRLEEIMQDRSKLGDEFTQEVNHQLKEWGVTTVKSIEFMDIRDSGGSQVIANIMAKEKSRIEMESRVAVADNKREAELREIDAKRTVDVQRQDAEQQVGIRTAEKDKTVGIADEMARQEILAQARSTTEREMEVQKVRDVKSAEIAKEVSIVRAEQDRQVTIVNSEAAQQQTVIAAEGEKQKTKVIAEGQLAAARNEAEGIKAKGEAEAKAEELILMAPVTAQITLAKEIGSNLPYQEYLMTVEQIKASQAVGTEMAKAIGEADLKVIANSGDMQSGVASIGDIFSPKGGTSLTGMLSALAATEEGAAVVRRLTGKSASAADAAKTTKGKPPEAA